ncbi:MAG: S8 family serine peptidase [Parcubacteria group bacterium]|nr:S8 family serine peptidase [Parcubacteria group bacterium]
MKLKKLFLLILIIVSLLSLSGRVQAATFDIDSLNLQEALSKTNPPAAYFKIDLKEAWQLINTASLNLSSITIGIIDTGVDIKHPEFEGVKFGNTPLDAKIDVGNLESHGTNVAGIIGANNISSASSANYILPQMNGVVSGVKNLDYTLENRKISKSLGIITVFSVNNKIFELSNSGAQIINLSLSGLFNISADIFFSANFFVHSNIFFVVSAGNDNTSASLAAPANLSFLDNVITIGATTLNDQRKADSNFGVSVNITAPGESVFSPTFFAPPLDLSDYEFFSGTSASAPMVTGVAAILKAIKPELTPGEIKDILQKSADPIKTDKPLGSGCFDPNNNSQGFNGCRLNAFKAVCRILTCSSSLIKNLPLGHITTVAGNGSLTFSGDGGLAILAGIGNPLGIDIDEEGNLFIADFFNHRIRRVDAETKIITTIAGTGNVIISPDGSLAISNHISHPNGLVVDSFGNIFFAEMVGLIRKIEGSSGILSTILKSGLNNPSTIAMKNITIDNNGDIFIADRDNHRILKVNSVTKEVILIAGRGTPGFSGDNGLAIDAQLQNPAGVAVDPNGNVFIADTNNHRIRHIDALTGIITTITGKGTRKPPGDCGIGPDIGIGEFSGDGGPAILAELNFPQGVAVDNVGHLFIADSFNHRVRQVDLVSGIITTIAGSGGTGIPQGIGCLTLFRGDFSGDNDIATLAKISHPTHLTLDKAGNLFISTNNRIRAVRLAP